MTDGYLSKDRGRLAKGQRARRARMVRVDYMPGKDAQAIIAIKRDQCRPGSLSATNSAVIDAIVTEWADLTGIKYGEVESPMTSGSMPELNDTYARAYDFGTPTPEFVPAPRAGADACGAKRHRDGQPCKARPEPGKARCRFHGGRSTGPRTPEGKSRAQQNLRQNRLAALNTTS
jgi:hypothetical protein